MAKAKCCGPCYCIGDKVRHAANRQSPPLFGEGVGCIVEVTPWNSADGYSYRVRCDATGQILPVNFKDSELSPSC